MPSPFPGMDPFLESAGIWGDFHQRFAVTLGTILTPLLPERYFVKVVHRAMTEHVPADQIGVVVPDAAVVTPRGQPRDSPDARSVASGIVAPVEIQLELPVPAKQHYLKILTVADERLVTAIEVLSPANKRAGTDDRRRYLRKRTAYLRSRVHFIEIDLLRSGRRWRAGDEPRRTYRVLLCRATRRLVAELWPISLREPLPRIPVPLLGGDPDVALDLQGVFVRTYDDAAYARYVRYDGAIPPPPLSPEDGTWVAERLAKTR